MVCLCFYSILNFSDFELNLFDYAVMTPESNAPSVDPYIVGNAFVHEYYNHLYESPAKVHKFYHENSVLGRPGLDGEMVYVNTLKVSSFNAIAAYISICL